ncbi:MAG: hypothetical protein EBZ48_00560 [Proteobacteria bacterium]|nr:hypothetical protein [Pseudomonadota bacterium]
MRAPESFVACALSVNNYRWLWVIMKCALWAILRGVAGMERSQYNFAAMVSKFSRNKNCMISKKTLSLCVVVALVLSACSDSAPLSGREKGTLGGAALGSGLGAIIGHATGSTGAGIAIGAGVGALTGGVLGNESDKQDARTSAQEERLRRQQEELDRQRRELNELKRNQDRSPTYPSNSGSGDRY